MITATDSVDLSVLHSFDDPEMGDGAELIIELIDLYQEESARIVETIRLGLQTDDWNIVRRGAHSLRGSSSNLGILQVSLIADDLEHLQIANVSTATQLLQSIEEELVRVNVILAQERGRRTA